MSTSSFNSFSVISFSISLSLLTASPTSSSSIKAFQEFNEEFACVKGHGRFSPPASRLLRAGVLTLINVWSNKINSSHCITSSSSSRSRSRTWRTTATSRPSLSPSSSALSRSSILGDSLQRIQAGRAESWARL